MLQSSPIRRAIALTLALALFAVPSVWAKPAFDAPESGLQWIDTQIHSTLDSLIAWFDAQDNDNGDDPTSGDPAGEPSDRGDSPNGGSSDPSETATPVPDPVG